MSSSTFPSTSVATTRRPMYAPLTPNTISTPLERVVTTELIIHGIIMLG